MTLIQSNPPGRITPCTTREIRVCWTSTHAPHDCGAGNGMTHSRFVLGIELAARGQAIVEAWVENGQGRRCVLARQPMNVAAVADHQLLHIDVMGSTGDGRIAAITIQAGMSNAAGGRALFAQTSLLEQAGFAAGSYDPPTVTQINA